MKLKKFVESKWLKNYLLALPADEFRNFDTSTSDIHSLDKDGNKVPRQLEMPAKFLQSVYKGVKNDMRSLAEKRGKTGRKNGSLKFCSQYRSIDLNQYGNTHWICHGDEGDRNGKYRNTVHIAGVKRPIRVLGMDQIPEDGEPANAKLICKASGIYMKMVFFIRGKDTGPNADPGRLLEAVGTDFGIKTTITTSDGEEYDISIRETERLKGLQKKLARQVRHSKGWYDTRRMIQREHERIANRRKDAADKTFRAITEGKDVLVIQDDNIKGWHKGLFRK